MVEYRLQEDKTRTVNVTYFIIFLFLISKKYIALVYNMLIQRPTKIVPILYVMFLILIMIQVLVIGISKSDISILMISMAIFIIGGENSLIIHVILAIASKHMKDKTIVKYYFIFNIVFFLGLVTFSELGIIPKNTEIYFRLLDNGDIVQRHDFGLGNPNTVFFNLMPVYTGYIYLRFEKYNILDRILIIFTTIYIYSRTYSRTGLIVIFTMLIMVELVKKVKLNKDNLNSKIIENMPWILCILSLVLGAFYSKNEVMNNVLAGRPKYWNYYLNNMNFIGWGRYNPEFPLDNSYIHMLSITGIITTIIVISTLKYGLKMSIRKKDKKLVVLILAFIIFGFTENIIFDTSLNFTLILIIKNYILQR